MSDVDEALRLQALAMQRLARARGNQPRKPLGRRLMENIVGDNDPTTQNTGERIGSLLNMAGEAMTFGLVGDEASAAVESLLPGVDYAQRRDFYRQQQTIAEDEAPIASTVAKVGGALATPGAAILAGGRGALSLGRAILTGGVTGATYAGAEGEGGIGNRLTEAGIGAGLGMAGGAAAVPIGRAVQWAGQQGGNALRKLFADRRVFDGNGLTAEGRATLEALGYNVDDLSAKFAQAFQRQLDQAIEPQNAAAAAELAEFGIPAMRANVTGSAEDFAALGRARAGAIGPRAEVTARRALEEQDAAMRAAADDIATGMGGPGVVDQADAANLAIQGVRQAQAAARDTARAAYDELELSGAGVSGQAIGNLGNSIQNALRTQNVRIDSLTPNATTAIAEINSRFAGAARGSVPFMEIERARQALVQMRSAAYRGSIGQDQIAMDGIVRAYDEAVDNLFTTAMTQGDDATLDMARRARGLWKEYRDQFLGDGASARFIQKMVDEDASPDDVVRWIFSAGRLGTGSFNSTVARGLKNTLGEDSEAWGAIRQAAFRQITQRPAGVDQWGPQAIGNRIGEFFTSPSTKALASTLFTREEQAQILRYRSALSRLVAPPGAMNTSGTAYENARNARQALQAITGMLGFSTGGPVGAGVAVAGQAVAARGADWLSAASLAPQRAARASAAPLAGGVLAGGMAQPINETFRPMGAQ